MPGKNTLIDLRHTYGNCGDGDDCGEFSNGVGGGLNGLEDGYGDGTEFGDNDGDGTSLRCAPPEFD